MVQQQDEALAKEVEATDSSTLWNDPNFVQWKNMELKKLLVSAEGFVQTIQRHLEGDTQVPFQDVRSACEAMDKDLYSLLKDSRKVLQTMERRNEVSDETLLESKLLSNLISAWRQYLTFLETTLRRTPTVEDLIQKAHLEDFFDFFTKNNHPSEEQGRSSASIYNRAVYLAQVLGVFKSHPSLFSHQAKEANVESHYFLNCLANIHKEKKRFQAKENNSFPVQRLELSDFSREDRVWLVSWLAEEIDAVAKGIQDNGSLNVQQAEAFQDWFESFYCVLLSTLLTFSLQVSDFVLLVCGLSTTTLAGFRLQAFQPPERQWPRVVGSTSDH